MGSLPYNLRWIDTLVAEMRLLRKQSDVDYNKLSYILPVGSKVAESNIGWKMMPEICYGAGSSIKYFHLNKRIIKAVNSMR